MRGFSKSASKVLVTAQLLKGASASKTDASLPKYFESDSVVRLIGS
jgi:hypothetical protein